MKRVLVVIFVVALALLPIVGIGCKGRAEKEAETAKTETTEATMPAEEVVVTQSPVTEPVSAQAVAHETIPPTASVPQAAETGKAAAAPADQLAKNKQIQTALKAANFYTGTVDGKLGPKTKRAIMEFQKAKGLKADGKVGPRTWAELEKYLTPQ